MSSEYNGFQGITVFKGVLHIHYIGVETNGRQSVTALERGYSHGFYTVGEYYLGQIFTICKSEVSYLSDAFAKINAFKRMAIGKRVIVYLLYTVGYRDARQTRCHKRAVVDLGQSVAKGHLPKIRVVGKCARSDLHNAVGNHDLGDTLTSFKRSRSYLGYGNTLVRIGYDELTLRERSYADHDVAVAVLIELKVYQHVVPFVSQLADQLRGGHFSVTRTDRDRIPIRRISIKLNGGNRLTHIECVRFNSANAVIERDLFKVVALTEGSFADRVYSTAKSHGLKTHTSVERALAENLNVVGHGDLGKISAKRECVISDLAKSCAEADAFKATRLKRAHSDISDAIGNDYTFQLRAGEEGSPAYTCHTVSKRDRGQS